MEFYGFDREAALKHCDSLEVGLARDLDRVRAWNRVRPEHVIELLDTAAPAARWEARNLAAQISRGSWRVHMDAAVVGKPQLVSNAREVQITAGGRDYRLKISEGVRLQLEEIVQGV